MSKYLFLEFKNAKLFPKPKKGDRFIVTDRSLISGKNTKPIDRENIPFYEEYITINHISNVLHVLFSQRPIPKNRTVSYERNEYLYQKALNSYLRINEKELYKKNKPITEIIQTKKALFNSYNPSPNISWLLINNYLGDCLYDKFIDILKQYNIEIIDKKVIDVIEKIREIFNSEDEIPNNFINELKINKKAVITNYFKTDYAASNLVKTKDICLTVNNGISNCIQLSGSIIVPVNDDDLIRLKEYSPGVATILDGGLVFIKKIINGDLFNDELYLQENYQLGATISQNTY